ncbi:MAG: adenylate/guanylate cyclase domain-containing protein [Actinomycetota bacterium]|nr:adenylate/guanylate cyclase domain-containing protein [Actinomycetota bacterium]
MRTAGEADQGRRGLVEAVLVRVGVPDHVARLLAATPSLRVSWFGATAVALGFSILAAYGRKDPLMFLVVAPLLPLGGVAAAFGPGVDPTYEVGLACPARTSRLLLIRATAVLAATSVLAGIASLALPRLDWTAAAWVLPSLGLTIATLALTTVMRPLWAVGTVAFLWVTGVVASETLSSVPDAAFRGPGQVAFFAVVVVAAPLFAKRREHLEMESRASRLFRQYVSPDVAEAMLADAGHTALGGSIVEVTVLFADLRGFTSYAELGSPDQVVAMLNRYFADVVPLILEQDGTVDKFVGDSMMALWGAPNRQPDHALRGARAALAMQTAMALVVARNPDFPCFRIGLNTGPALVGNIGSDQVRNFTAIGDTVNVAARLQETAQPGEVVIGPGTCESIRHRAIVSPLGPVRVRGKEQPVEAFVLEGLGEERVAMTRPLKRTTGERR